jgi:hypothetical protein
LPAGVWTLDRRAQLGLLVALGLLAPATGRAAETPTAPVSAEGARQVGRPSLARRLLSDRLVLGLRFAHFWLEDTRRSEPNGYDNNNHAGNFLGSLWGLDARQRSWPSPFLEYRVVGAFGAGLAYDQARAHTLDWADAEHTVTAGDGDVEIRGLQLYVFARYPNPSRFTPHARLGLVCYRSRFHESPGWAAPGRHFEADDISGWFLAMGWGVALPWHTALDLSYRHTQVPGVSARAYLNKNHNRAGVFPMTNDAVVAGLSYRF